MVWSMAWKELTDKNMISGKRASVYSFKKRINKGRKTVGIFIYSNLLCLLLGKFHIMTKQLQTYDRAREIGNFDWRIFCTLPPPPTLCFPLIPGFLRPILPFHSDVNHYSLTPASVCSCSPKISNDHLVDKPCACVWALAAPCRHCSPSLVSVMASSFLNWFLASPSHASYGHLFLLPLYTLPWVSHLIWWFSHHLYLDASQTNAWLKLQTWTG